MGPTTEAACLLETGALYGRRLLLKPVEGDPVFAGFKPGAFSLYFGDAPIFHFDREGRWQRAYVAGRHYLKGLDAAVQTIDRVREGGGLVLKRETLNFADARDFDALVRSAALDLAGALDAGRLEAVGPPAGARPVTPDELRDALEGVGRWDAAAWFAHREAYLAAYGPLPFVPPDCPLPVVLQATLGHGSGRAFGAAPAAEFYARSPDEFRAHAGAVARLLGRRVEQCKSVFLGGGDALLQPPEIVAACLEAAAGVFPVDPNPGRRHPDPSGEAPHRLDGVHAFLDDFPGPPLDPETWGRFRALGLVRVTLGVESGDPEVRALYGRGWPDDRLRETASALKGAGIGVGVVALVGAGGAGHAARHREATAALVGGLPLGPGDLVSLVDAVEIRGDAPGPDLTPLGPDARAEERDGLRSGLARSLGGAKVLPYSLAKRGPA